MIDVILILETWLFSSLERCVLWILGYLVFLHGASIYLGLLIIVSILQFAFFKYTMSLRSCKLNKNHLTDNIVELMEMLLLQIAFITNHLLYYDQAAGSLFGCL